MTQLFHLPRNWLSSCNQRRKKREPERQLLCFLSFPEGKVIFRAAFRSTAAAAAEVGLLLLLLLSGQHKKRGEITGLNIQALPLRLFLLLPYGSGAGFPYLIAYTSGRARAAKQLRSKISQVYNCHVKQFCSLRYRQTIQCSHRHFTVHS